MYIFLIAAGILFILFLWIGPASLFNKKKKKTVGALRESYKRVVIRNLLSIAEVNMFGNSLIAIDKKSAKLVLIVHNNDITWEKCIHLGKIVFCQVVKYHDRLNGAVQRVTLQLILENNQGEINFSFFDAEIDDMRHLPGRLRKAQFWRNEVQMLLSTFKLNNVS